MPRIYIYVDTHIHICIYTYVYMYIYKHIYTSTYTHSHTHTPTHTIVDFVNLGTVSHKPLLSPSLGYLAVILSEGIFSQIHCQTDTFLPGGFQLVLTPFVPHPTLLLLPQQSPPPVVPTLQRRQLSRGSSFPET